MPTQTETNVAKLKINRLTQTQFDGATTQTNELYLVDPEFSGAKILGTDNNGEVIETSLSIPSAGDSSKFLKGDGTWASFDDSNLVHKTGNEEIEGIKTFKAGSTANTLTVSNPLGSPAIRFKQGNTDFSYIGMPDANRIGQLTGGNSPSWNKSIVRSNWGAATGSTTEPVYIDSNGVATPITSYSGNAAGLTNLTATITELNYCDGVTSNIQTQLNGKLSNDSSVTSNLGILSSSISGTYSVALGYGSTSAGTATAVGGSSTASGAGSVAFGEASSSTGTRSISVGYMAKAEADYAIQLGIGTNNTANTLSVGLASGSNYELLDSNGIIPSARLANALQGAITSTTVTLDAADWSSNTQTVNVTGMTATKVVWISPSGSSMSDYADAGVYCSAQGSGTLTFTCSTTPTNDLTVQVVFG